MGCTVNTRSLTDPAAGPARSKPGLVLACLCLGLGACTNLSGLEQNLRQVSYQSADLAYTLDRNNTEVRFKVGPNRGRFRVADARLSFPTLQVESAVLEVTLVTASVDMRNPLVEQMLKGKDWFNANTYPLALFKTTVGHTQLREQAGELPFLDVQGQLTIRSEAHPLQLRVTFPEGLPSLQHPPEQFTFSAAGAFSREQYGMTALPGMAPDQVEINVNGAFQREQPTQAAADAL